MCLVLWTWQHYIVSMEIAEFPHKHQYTALKQYAAEWWEQDLLDARV